VFTNNINIFDINTFAIYYTSITNALKTEKVLEGLNRSLKYDLVFNLLYLFMPITLFKPKMLGHMVA
jgi:hypothetical protein